MAAQLDDDPELERVLPECLDDEGGFDAQYRVVDPPEGGLWVLPHDAWGHGRVCDGPSWPGLVVEGALAIRNTGPGESEERHVALRGGRPAVVRAEAASSGYGSGVPAEGGEDWDALSFWERRDLTMGDCGALSGPRSFLDLEGSVLPVLAEGRPPAPVRAAFVRGGRIAWRGDVDGALEVHAWEGPAGSVRFVVAVTDDRTVALADGFDCRDDLPSPGDRVVFSWDLSGSPDVGDPFGCGAELPPQRTVTVAAGPGGSAVLLEPEPCDPAEALRGSFERFELVVPADELPAPAEDGSFSTRLAVELVDDDGEEGETTIAISRAIGRYSVTYGRLVHLPGGARYPAPFGARAETVTPPGGRR